VLRGKLSRVGLSITLVGFAVLGASLYDWIQTSPLHRPVYTEDEYQWIRADSSNAPAVESDEIWQLSATCQRPYFVEAAEQARTKLKAYNDTSPDEIRAWRNRPREQRETEKGFADSDDGLKLHAKYQDWFLAELRLERQLEQWERRLGTVADKSITLREARRRITDIRLYIGDDMELASAGRDFTHFVLFLLGLGGFSDDQVNAIKAACIDVVPVKRIVTKTIYRTDIRRWPVDDAAAFCSGFALAFFGLVLSPVASWIRARR
jgi:hypothetical protein